MARRINKFLYAVFSVAAVAFGALSLLRNDGSFPFEQHHLERELGAAAVFIGLMALWCLLNYDRRRGVHLSLLVFAALLSLIHWQDFFAGHRTVRSIIFNSVPLVTLLLISALSRVHAATTAAEEGVS